MKVLRTLKNNVLNSNGEIVVVDELPTKEEACAGRDRHNIQENFVTPDGGMVARWAGTSQPAPEGERVAVVTHKDEWNNGRRYSSTAEIYVTSESLRRLRKTKWESNVFTSCSPGCGEVKL